MTRGKKNRMLKSTAECGGFCNRAPTLPMRTPLSRHELHLTRVGAHFTGISAHFLDSAFHLYGSYASSPSSFLTTNAHLVAGVTALGDYLIEEVVVLSMCGFGKLALTPADNGFTITTLRACQNDGEVAVEHDQSRPICEPDNGGFRRALGSSLV